MLKNRIRNFNIDILAKDYNSFTPCSTLPRHAPAKRGGMAEHPVPQGWCYAPDVSRRGSGAGPHPTGGQGDKNRLIDINYVRIESKLDFKKTKNSNSSKIGAISSQGKHSQLILKRNRYKLMRLWGQAPKFILAKKSVAEWQLRKDMIIGNMITLRGGSAELDRFYRLLFMIALPRDNKLLTKKNIVKPSKKPWEHSIKKLGINENNGESLIIINDWPMSDYIENNLNKHAAYGGRGRGAEHIDKLSLDASKQMEEMRELKLLNLGMDIFIKINNLKYQSLVISYLPFSPN